jgi:hypothetical protein
MVYALYQHYRMVCAIPYGAYVWCVHCISIIVRIKPSSWCLQVLEQALMKHCTLSVGDTLSVEHAGFQYVLRVGMTFTGGYDLGEERVLGK